MVSLDSEEYGDDSLTMSGSDVDNGELTMNYVSISYQLLFSSVYQSHPPLEGDTLSEFESEKNIACQQEHSEPLFEGSSVSTLQAYVMLFQYALRHHLSSKVLSELLLLLKVLLPAGNTMPRSMYLLKSFFVKAFSNIEINEQPYCRDCHTLLDQQSDQCSNILCSGDHFDRFIAIPIGPQLVQMMKGMQVLLLYFVTCTYTQMHAYREAKLACLRELPSVIYSLYIYIAYTTEAATQFKHPRYL